MKIFLLYFDSAGGKNRAFVFIKPHAVTDACKKLVTDSFSARGISVLTEGSLSSEEIDKKKLIDQHYYGSTPSSKLPQCPD